MKHFYGVVQINIIISTIYYVKIFYFFSFKLKLNDNELQYCIFLKKDI